MKKAALRVKDSAQGAAEGGADGRTPDDYAQRRGQEAAKDAFRTAAGGITRRKRQGADGRDGGGSAKQGKDPSKTRERMQRRAAERRAKKRGADASVKGHAERQANIKKRDAPAVKSKGRALKKNVRHRQSALPRPFGASTMPVRMRQKAAAEYAAKQMAVKAAKKKAAAKTAKAAGAFRDAGGEHRQPSPDRIPTGIFSWPLDSAGEITSWFGWREDPFTGEWKYHDGVDIGVPDGTPILAAADGTVTVANMTDSYAGGWGYYVRVSHAGGYETLYAHCSALAVRQGDAVTKGQVIAYVGSTGRSTGNHLHWEVYVNGSRVDPLDFFE